MVVSLAGDATERAIDLWQCLWDNSSPPEINRVTPSGVHLSLGSITQIDSFQCSPLLAANFKRQMFVHGPLSLRPIINWLLIDCSTLDSAAESVKNGSKTLQRLQRAELKQPISIWCNYVQRIGNLKSLPIPPRRFILISRTAGQHCRQADSLVLSSLLLLLSVYCLGTVAHTEHN